MGRSPSGVRSESGPSKGVAMIEPSVVDLHRRSHAHVPWHSQVGCTPLCISLISVSVSGVEVHHEAAHLPPRGRGGEPVGDEVEAVAADVHECAAAARR